MSSDPKQLLRQILANLPIDIETKKDAERGIERMTAAQASEVSRKLTAVFEKSSGLFRLSRKKPRKKQNNPPSAQK